MVQSPSGRSSKSPRSQVEDGICCSDTHIESGNRKSVRHMNSGKEAQSKTSANSAKSGKKLAQSKRDISDCREKRLLHGSETHTSQPSSPATRSSRSSVVGKNETSSENAKGVENSGVGIGETDPKEKERSGNSGTGKKDTVLFDSYDVVTPAASTRSRRGKGNNPLEEAMKKPVLKKNQNNTSPSRDQSKPVAELPGSNKTVTVVSKDGRSTNVGTDVEKKCSISGQALSYESGNTTQGRSRRSATKETQENNSTAKKSEKSEKDSIFTEKEVIKGKEEKKKQGLKRDLHEPELSNTAKRKRTNDQKEPITASNQCIGFSSSEHPKYGKRGAEKTLENILGRERKSRKRCEPSHTTTTSETEPEISGKGENSFVKILDTTPAAPQEVSSTSNFHDMKQEGLWDTKPENSQSVEIGTSHNMARTSYYDPEVTLAVRLLKVEHVLDQMAQELEDSSSKSSLEGDHSKFENKIKEEPVDFEEKPSKSEKRVAEQDITENLDDKDKDMAKNEDDKAQDNAKNVGTSALDKTKDAGDKAQVKTKCEDYEPEEKAKNADGKEQAKAENADNKTWDIAKNVNDKGQDITSIEDHKAQNKGKNTDDKAQDISKNVDDKVQNIVQNVGFGNDTFKVSELISDEVERKSTHTVGQDVNNENKTYFDSSLENKDRKKMFEDIKFEGNKTDKAFEDVDMESTETDNIKDITFTSDGKREKKENPTNVDYDLHNKGERKKFESGNLGNLDADKREQGKDFELKTEGVDEGAKLSNDHSASGENTLGMKVDDETLQPDQIEMVEIKQEIPDPYEEAEFVESCPVEDVDIKLEDDIEGFEVVAEWSSLPSNPTCEEAMSEEGLGTSASIDIAEQVRRPRLFLQETVSKSLLHENSSSCVEETYHNPSPTGPASIDFISLHPEMSLKGAEGELIEPGEEDYGESTLATSTVNEECNSSTLEATLSTSSHKEKCLPKVHEAPTMQETSTEAVEAGVVASTINKSCLEKAQTSQELVDERNISTALSQKIKATCVKVVNSSPKSSKAAISTSDLLESEDVIITGVEPASQTPKAANVSPSMAALIQKVCSPKMLGQMIKSGETSFECGGKVFSSVQADKSSGKSKPGVFRYSVCEDDEVSLLHSVPENTGVQVVHSIGKGNIVNPEGAQPSLKSSAKPHCDQAQIKIHLTSGKTAIINLKKLREPSAKIFPIDGDDRLVTLPLRFHVKDKGARDGDKRSESPDLPAVPETPLKPSETVSIPGLSKELMSQVSTTSFGLPRKRRERTVPGLLVYPSQLKRMGKSSGLSLLGKNALSATLADCESLKNSLDVTKTPRANNAPSISSKGSEGSDTSDASTSTKGDLPSKDGSSNEDANIEEPPGLIIPRPYGRLTTAGKLFFDEIEENCPLSPGSRAFAETLVKQRDFLEDERHCEALEKIGLVPITLDTVELINPVANQQRNKVFPIITQSSFESNQAGKLQEPSSTNCHLLAEIPKFDKGKSQVTLLPNSDTGKSTYMVVAPKAKLQESIVSFPTLNCGSQVSSAQSMTTASIPKVVFSSAPSSVSTLPYEVSSPQVSYANPVVSICLKNAGVAHRSGATSQPKMKSLLPFPSTLKVSESNQQAQKVILEPNILTHSAAKVQSLQADVMTNNETCLDRKVTEPHDVNGPPSIPPTFVTSNGARILDGKLVLPSLDKTYSSDDMEEESYPNTDGVIIPKRSKYHSSPVLMNSLVENTE